MNEQLIAILKKKGTGESMGKSLQQEDLDRLPHLLRDPKNHLTTKATLLTAILMLPPTDLEKAWITDTLYPQATQLLEPELQALLDPTKRTHPFWPLLDKVLTHTDLNEKEFKDGMAYVMAPDTPAYLKAIFLEAERLKRETKEENLAALTYLSAMVKRPLSKLPLLIDISNPYDGFTRTPLFSPFVAATLGACGYPTLLHGVHSCGPKWGITPSKLLRLASKSTESSYQKVIDDLHSPSIGWGYIDMESFFPELYALQEVRTHMVKRPLLSTVEKLMLPITAEKLFCITGYTHPPYKDKLKDMLTNHPIPHEFVILRGVEGSTQLPLDRPCPIITKDAVPSAALDFVRPSHFGFDEHLPSPMECTEKASLEEGLKALLNVENDARRHIIYQGAAILSSCHLLTPKEAVACVTEAIQSGKALTHWINGALGDD